MNKQIDKYIDVVGDLYSNLPSLPVGIQKIIVEIVPWLAFIFGLIATAFAIISLGALPFPGHLAIFTGTTLTGGEVLQVILNLIASILLFSSFVGVQKKRVRGWKLLYSSEVVRIIINIIQTTIVGFIFSLIALYFLYQIKKYYK